MSLINNHFKTFLISLLSLTLLFSISCNDAYKPSDKEPSDKDGTRTLSYYAGDWYSIDKHKFTINADGSVIIKFALNNKIPSTSITKNSDTSYTYYDATDNGYMYFNFTSDTLGKITIESGSTESGSTTLDIDVTKR